MLPFAKVSGEAGISWHRGESKLRGPLSWGYPGVFICKWAPNCTSDYVWSWFVLYRTSFSEGNEPGWPVYLTHVYKRALCAEGDILHPSNLYFCASGIGVREPIVSVFLGYGVKEYEKIDGPWVMECEKMVGSRVKECEKIVGPWVMECEKIVGPRVKKHANSF